ncbi:hypothetical protein [Methylobacterium durans]|uniref:Uncharacterized protein n=1 Tax=Methylobacterium durans TaxID=2202825 RepID=A0A2U8WBA4_9HYPH|nr:hypothetical protein [Methylobacterium durans]AWN42730.1 hypothetical protein DK389_22260 [Methylobacterium durans]
MHATEPQPVPPPVSEAGFDGGAGAHPEEMRASLDLAIGRFVRLRATARATPAGLLATAILAAATLGPLLWFARSRRRC